MVSVSALVEDVCVCEGWTNAQGSGGAGGGGDGGSCVIWRLNGCTVTLNTWLVAVPGAYIDLHRGSHLIRDCFNYWLIDYKLAVHCFWPTSCSTRGLIEHARLPSSGPLDQFHSRWRLGKLIFYKMDNFTNFFTVTITLERGVQ